MKKRGQLHHTTWFFLIVLVVIIALGAYYLFPGETAETSLGDGTGVTEQAGQTTPTQPAETLPKGVELVNKGPEELREERIQACIEQEGFGHADYLRCSALVNNDILKCDKISLRDYDQQNVLRCKDETKVFLALKSKQIPTLESDRYKTNDFNKLIEAIVSSDVSKCSGLPVDHLNICLAVLNKDTGKIDGQGYATADNYYIFSAILSDDLMLCNSISASDKKAQCLAMLSKDITNCKPIVEEFCNTDGIKLPPQ